jgi:hypothetical protein
MYKKVIKITLIAFVLLSSFFSFSMYQTYREIDKDEL